MHIVKKALYGTLALVLSLSAVSASAEEKSNETSKPRAILFKLHDIKPAENSEGIVTNCDFLVTFYNRTTDSLRSAKIDMGWTDEVTNRYLVDNDEKISENTAKNQNARNNDAKVSLGEITTSVEMPSLGSYKQVTVKGSAKTEKCFLLLDNLNFKVDSCSIVGKDDANATQNSRRSRVNAGRDNSECANLFEYVDSKNPEYYDEFKNISFSEQERLLNDEKAQDTSEIENTYEDILKNVQKASDIMANIK